MSDYLMHTYHPLPVSFTHGKGAWLWDSKGRSYLDSMAGIAVNALGHAHPAVVKTITEQAGKVIHTSNSFEIEFSIKLAEKLCKISHMQQAFFSNSGAEANEAALKLCRLYGHKRNIENPHIIVLEKSFHGRTLATLSASGSRKVQAGFEPLVQGFIRAPFNDLKALETILMNRNDIAAIMIEPILGNGGIQLCSENYLPEVRKLCDKYECLMVLDEIQTGVGRTGKYFAYQHYDVLPDIVTVAKALANGVPIGACLSQGRALDLFKPGNHGSTFGGNPLATATALTVLNVIEKDHLLPRVIELGNMILSGLQKELKNHPSVKDIRGKGLMIGVELDAPCDKLGEVALEHGLLVNITAEKVIRIIPAFILTDEEAHEMVKRIVTSVKDYCSRKV